MSLEADIARCLAQHPAVRLGILFGSVNEGRAGYESALDLAVMGERALSAEEKMALIETLARRTGPTSSTCRRRAAPCCGTSCRPAPASTAPMTCSMPNSSSGRSSTRPTLRRTATVF